MIRQRLKPTIDSIVANIDQPAEALVHSTELCRQIERLEVEMLAEPDLAPYLEGVAKVVGRIHGRIRHVVVIDDIFNQLNSAPDLETALDLAEEARRLCREAINQSDLWHSWNLVVLREAETEATRQFIFHRANRCQRDSWQIIKGAHTPEAVESACDMMIEAMARLIEEGREVLSPSERRNLAMIKAEFAATRKKTKEEFAVLMAQAEAELSAQRKAFCNERAAADLNAAGGIVRGQAGKRLNWGWMGYPRDSFEDLVRAIRLCNRVVSSSLVADEFRGRAVNVRDSILKRFNRKEIARYHGHPNMPGYHTLSGYPNWNIRDAALDDWRFLRHPPVFSETQASSDRGRIIVVQGDPHGGIDVHPHDLADKKKTESLGE